MPKHQNKHIQAAIEYAERKGWRVTKSSGSAHIWGKIWCPHRERDGCRRAVFSTPRNAQTHARKLRRYVDQCPHSG